MKKFFVLLLIVVLSLSGCIKTDDIENNKVNQSENHENVINNEQKEQEDHNEEQNIPIEENKNEEEEQKEETKKEDVKQEIIKEDSKEEDKQEEHHVNETIEVSYPVQTFSSTLTGRKALDPIKFIVKDPYNIRGLSEKKYSFSFGAAKDFKPHSITIDNQKKFDNYKTNALAWDNKTEEKVVYLTFDCGYEYKNLTSKMLDTLKEKNVKGAFFITMEYIEEAPEVVARMINEGHIVGNHSVNHPSNAAALSREELAKELLGVHNYLRVNYGYESEYFRFPTGTYSQNAIELVHSLNYRSVFWSIAHSDWDPENQPGVEKSFETITARLHPGAVVLLHTTSPDNAEILGDYIDYIREQGYEIRTLDQYDYWK